MSTKKRFIVPQFDQPYVSALSVEPPGTCGDWNGVYGADGYCVTGSPWSANSPANELRSLPSYITSMTFTGHSYFTWTGSTTETRALRRPDNLSNRIAACWSATSTWSVAISMTDTTTRRVYIYCLDWDSARAQTVTMNRTSDSTVLASDSISNFRTPCGKWLSYDFNESVTISVTKTGGANGVASGFFFDTPSATTRGFRSPPFF